MRVRQPINADSQSLLNCGSGVATWVSGGRQWPAGKTMDGCDWISMINHAPPLHWSWVFDGSMQIGRWRSGASLTLFILSISIYCPLLWSVLLLPSTFSHVLGPTYLLHSYVQKQNVFTFSIFFFYSFIWLK